jgi:four helix bundle protein
VGQIERFEDLLAWSKARILTKAIYQVCSQGRLAKDFGLSGQMQRAAVSIMSNIAEGFERRSLAEFQQFLTIAKASCAELRSQLYVALDCEYIDQPDFTQLHAQAEEVARIISGLRTSVERKRQHQQNGK